MIVLRVFLYIICIISISWSILVFGGPTVIKRLIIAYSNGSVIPSNISVTPTLQIKIGRMEYDFKATKAKVPIAGFSRSTEVFWSFFGEQPFLTVDIGPTVLKDFAIAEN